MKSFALSLLLNSISAYNWDASHAFALDCNTDDDCDYVCGFWVTVDADQTYTFKACVDEPKLCDSQWDGGIWGLYDVHCTDTDYLDWKYDYLEDTVIELTSA